MTLEGLRLDAENAGECPSDLYQRGRTGRMLDSVQDVTAEEVQAFARDGYLAVGEVLDAEDIDQVLGALASVLADPGDAIVQYEAWGDDARGDDAAPQIGVERMDLVRKFMSFTAENARLQALARDERILGVVRRLCGSEDLSMIQDMALLKPPGGGREKPWHQDNAFFAYEPGTPIVGVWIALDPATPENGCMHVIPGSQAEGPAPHFRRRDWQLCDTDVDRARDTTVPLPAGGALFFHGLLKHGTPANHTSLRRRAVQFHYVPADTVHVSDQRRLDIFGSEGKDVTC